MSAKSSKKSRRECAAMEKNFKVINQAMAPRIIAEYHRRLTQLSLRK